MPDWLQRLLPEGWTAEHLIWLSLGLFIVMAAVSLLAVGYALMKLPEDYFVPGRQAEIRKAHPLRRWTLAILKNLFGVMLILVGVVLALPGVPGQGILTILLGVMLLDVPIFRRFERWLIARRGVLAAVNKLRQKYGKPPLRLE